MTTTITDEFTTLIDGPFYEHSPQVTAAILPFLPSGEELHAEFCAEIRSLAGDVAVLPLIGKRHAVIATAPGTVEVFKRAKLYGKASIENEIFEALASGEDTAGDEIHATALALARQYAQRVTEQVAAFRVGRGTRLEAPAVVRHLGAHIPALLHRRGGTDAPRICVDETRDAYCAIYAAYYVITPPGPEVVEEP